MPIQATSERCSRAASHAALLAEQHERNGHLTLQFDKAVIGNSHGKQVLHILANFIQIEVFYGIRGLSDYLGVSPPTAQKYVNSGKLDAAMRKVGRKYSFNKAAVDEIFRKR